VKDVNKNRILLVAASDSEFKKPCRRALLRLGYKVDFFNYRSGLYFKNRIIRELYRIIPGAKTYLKKRISKTFFKIVKSRKPDYVFCINAETILPETIENVKKMGIIAINWYSEYMNQWNLNKILAPAYDFFFSGDPYIIDRLENEFGLKNCYYLPLAFDLKENSVNPFENRKEEFDISVVASYSDIFYRNRTEAFIAIKDLGLNIWGPKNWLESPLKDYYRGKADGDKAIEIYRKSKIVPNTHYNLFPTDGVTLRPFEAMGAGALLICDDVGSDIYKLFKDGEEFILFQDGNIAQLREKVKYYLAHPEERINIARKGYESIVAKHTYEIRMKQMMSMVLSDQHIAFY